MILFEETEVVGWRHAIRGMRNPLNSWDKIDSFDCDGENCISSNCPYSYCSGGEYYDDDECLLPEGANYVVGPNDLGLMRRLNSAGTDHRKFMRMIVVYLDITAPLYWWKEFDTYKVGTVANSCSTMHKIHAKEFTLDDFSCEHLFGERDERDVDEPIGVMNMVIDTLNENRKAFLETKDKYFWWQMIQMLPSSYNQKRTVMLNYEVLSNMYKSRKSHKLDEWRQFCDWIKELPYSEFIVGGTEDEVHG